MSAKSTGKRGLLAPLIGCFLSILPCIAALGPYSWLFGAIWVGLSGLRWFYTDQDFLTDCVIYGIIGTTLERDGLLERWKELELWGRFDDPELANCGTKSSRSTTIVGITVLLALSSISIILGFWNSKPEGRISNPDMDERTLEHPRSLIFPCRTTHARTFPQRHAFGYSYLLFGVPITPARNSPSRVATDEKDKTKGKWWMQVRAEDYLERGSGESGFYGKLQMFLRSEGVQDSEWSYAYLVTAPRFFGYSFNPVSFWYIYDHLHEFRRMILEVNNTFGERRVYLLDGSSPPSPPTTPCPESPSIRTTKSKFSDIWEKDFHVSPFNSRKGSYALKAANPFPQPNLGGAKIDNTITLKSSKDHAKIVARVYSTDKPLDASTLGLWGTIRFVCGWWWVGLVTSPRILREAFKLYFQRGLHVWLRPEVKSSSIGRKPTPDEATLQEVFRDYLQFLVRRSGEKWEITLYTAIPNRPREIITSTFTRSCEVTPKRLELRAVTPAFYSRFVHYAHISEAFDRECLFTDERNRTLWISNPELVPLLLKTPQETARNARTFRNRRGWIDELRWTSMKKLRCAPPEPAYSVTPKSAHYEFDDIRSLPFSDLDHYARGPDGRSIAAKYRRIVTRIFLAQRCAFGFVEMIGVVDLVLRSFLCYFGVMALISGAREMKSLEADSRTLSHGNLPRMSVGDLSQEWLWIANLAIQVCACHLYGLMKG